jgi:hypothetical protein
VLLVFMAGVFLRARLKPKFTAAERTVLKRTWMPSTLLRVLLRHPDIADTANELVPITSRTQHFFSPNQIVSCIMRLVRCCMRSPEFLYTAPLCARAVRARMSMRAGGSARLGRKSQARVPPSHCRVCAVGPF